MGLIDSNHLMTEQLDAPRWSKADILRTQPAVHFALGVDQMHSCEHARAENWPHFFFCEGAVFLNPDRDLVFERIVDILKDEHNFVEGWTERVFGFCGEVEKIENMLIFIGEFEGVGIEGVLIGFLRRKGVLFEEVKVVCLVMLDYVADR